MRASTLLNQKNQILIKGLLVILSAALFCGWVLSPSNFFQFDDYQWQWRTQTTSYGNLFNIIPHAPYNDRPVGAVFLKALFGAFGVNNVLHHCVFLLVHIASSLLFFCLIRIVLRDYLHHAGTDNWKQNIPWVSAVFFAGWSTSTLRVVSWDAAIFDLLAAPLVLLSAICYVKAQRQGIMRLVLSVGCLLCYGLALRSKEMVIALPCMLACISFWDHFWQKRCLHRRAPSNPALLIALFTLMVIYIARIIWIKSANHDLADPSNPYFISTSPIILLRNFCRYMAMYYNPFQNDYIGANGSLSMPFYGFYMVLILGFVWIAIRSFLRSYSPIILIPILFVLMIAPVLPMQNMQTRLYLYLPSMILSLLTATGICWGLSKVRMTTATWRLATLAGVAFLILGFISTNGVNPICRNFYLSVGRENKKIYNSLSKIPRPSHGSTVYLVNVPEWLAPYCLFAEGSGRGDVLKSYFNDASIETKSLAKINNQQLIIYENSGITINYLLLENTGKNIRKNSAKADE
jgi:hypothetical protein